MHAASARRHPPQHPRRVAAAILAGTAIAAVTAWGTLAITYRAPAAYHAGAALAAGFATLGTLAIAGIARRRMRVATMTFLVVLAAVMLWWSRIMPRNDREWQPDVAVLATADVHDHWVTVHNIRNFDYRSETDFTPRYYDKTFDLDALDTLDLIASYWMGDAIAHIMVSFGFAGREYLAVSIETRKEAGESYSTLAGFFKEYELYYVVADERDVLRVRTNYRRDPPEDVYLYRTNLPPETVRRIFLSYVRQLNALAEHPAFYDTLTTNCTTTIWTHTQVNPEHVRWNWKILASGYVPLLAYESGRLETALPFEELRRRGHINEAARAADDAADFSQRVRAAVPQPPRAVAGR